MLPILLTAMGWECERTSSACIEAWLAAWHAVLPIGARGEHSVYVMGVLARAWFDLLQCDRVLLVL